MLFLLQDSGFSNVQGAMIWWSLHLQATSSLWLAWSHWLHMSHWNNTHWHWHGSKLWQGHNFSREFRYRDDIGLFKLDKSEQEVQVLTRSMITSAIWPHMWAKLMEHWALLWRMSPSCALDVLVCRDPSSTSMFVSGRNWGKYRSYIRAWSSDHQDQQDSFHCLTSSPKVGLSLHWFVHTPLGLVEVKDLSAGCHHWPIGQRCLVWIPLTSWGTYSSSFLSMPWSFPSKSCHLWILVTFPWSSLFCLLCLVFWTWKLYCAYLYVCFLSLLLVFRCFWGKSTMARDMFGPSPEICWLLGNTTLILVHILVQWDTRIRLLHFTCFAWCL